jgi:hypothetical protein
MWRDIRGMLLKVTRQNTDEPALSGSWCKWTSSWSLSVWWPSRSETIAVRTWGRAAGEEMFHVLWVNFRFTPLPHRQWQKGKAALPSPGSLHLSFQTQLATHSKFRKLCATSIRSAQTNKAAGPLIRGALTYTRPTCNASSSCSDS